MLHFITWFLNKSRIHGLSKVQESSHGAKAFKKKMCPKDIEIFKAKAP